jgi:hypothetical protein
MLMNPWLNYFVYYFCPVIAASGFILIVNRRMISKNWAKLDRISKSNEDALEIQRQSLIKLGEIKTLLEDRKA